jgi:hypothetical protein
VTALNNCGKFHFIFSNPLGDIPLSVFLANFSTTYDVIAQITKTVITLD